MKVSRKYVLSREMDGYVELTDRRNGKVTYQDQCPDDLKDTFPRLIPFNLPFHQRDFASVMALQEERQSYVDEYFKEKVKKKTKGRRKKTSGGKRKRKIPKSQLQLAESLPDDVRKAMEKALNLG
jgi:hypothetical protein